MHPAIDLHSILEIRKAFQPIPAPMHAVNKMQDNDCIWFKAWVEHEEQSLEDDIDEGGDVALAQPYNSAQIKIHQLFDLLFNMGHIICFKVVMIMLFCFCSFLCLQLFSSQAYSCKV